MDSVPLPVSHTREILTVVPPPVHPNVPTEGEDPAQPRVFQNVVISQVKSIKNVFAIQAFEIFSVSLILHGEHNFFSNRISLCLFKVRFVYMKYSRTHMGITFFGLREEDEVADFFVFSHIRMRDYFRLGYVRVNECPVGLESPPHCGARKRSKATVKINEETRYFDFFL